jgi:hypothetical protein
MQNIGIFNGHLEYFIVIWDILWSFQIPYGHFEYVLVISNISCTLGRYIYSPLVYFTVIWYMLQSFGVFCGHLVYFTKKNLATLRILNRYRGIAKKSFFV